MNLLYSFSTWGYVISTFFFSFAEYLEHFPIGFTPYSLNNIVTILLSFHLTQTTLLIASNALSYVPLSFFFIIFAVFNGHFSVRSSLTVPVPPKPILCKCLIKAALLKKNIENATSGNCCLRNVAKFWTMHPIFPDPFDRYHVLRIYQSLDNNRKEKLEPTPCTQNERVYFL